MRIGSGRNDGRGCRKGWELFLRQGKGRNNSKYKENQQIQIFGQGGRGSLFSYDRESPIFP